jgi:ribonuclease BN (tRNA processing enzyme)
VPAVGFAALAADGGAWVYTGDTGPNPALWERLAALPLRVLVIETAFRDDEHRLAQVSRHLCPAMLERELGGLTQTADIYITHIKPGEVDAVMAEIGAWRGPQSIHALVTGQVLTIAEHAG